MKKNFRAIAIVIAIFVTFSISSCKSNDIVTDFTNVSDPNVAVVICEATGGTSVNGVCK